MSDITNSDGAEFYYFEETKRITKDNVNSSFNNVLDNSITYNSINGTNFDSNKYHVSTETNKYWYDTEPNGLIIIKPIYLTPNCTSGSSSGIVGDATDIIVSHSVTSLSEAGFKESNIQV